MRSCRASFALLAWPVGPGRAVASRVGCVLVAAGRCRRGSPTAAASACGRRADAQPARIAAELASPLSPEQALAAFRVDPGVRVELVAAEPLVESPVAVAFDARGRMFVAENRGYPTGPVTAGRIAMLEDTDGDGTFDRRTEFADGLSLSQRPDALARRAAGHLRSRFDLSGRHRRRRPQRSSRSAVDRFFDRRQHATAARAIRSWASTTGSMSPAD